MKYLLRLGFCETSVRPYIIKTCLMLYLNVEIKLVLQLTMTFKHLLNGVQDTDLGDNKIKAKCIMLCLSFCC